MSGTTYTFTQSAGGADWNTAGNWTQGTTVAAGVPNGATDVAIITDHEPFIDSTTDTVAQLEVSGNGHLIVGGSTLVGTPGNGGTLAVVGTIVATSTNTGGALVGGVNGVFTAAEMFFGTGALIGGGGTLVAPTMINNGVILADGQLYDLGELLLSGNTITGTGSLEIQGSSILDLNIATAQNVNVNTTGTSHPVLTLANPDTYTGTVVMGQADASLEVVLGGTVGHLMGLINGGNTLGIDSNAIALNRGADNTFALTGGVGDDTIFGAGAGTISGGGGTNTLVANNTSIATTVVSTGTGDLVVVSSGNATVTASGDNTGILMSGTGEVTANLSGTGDTVAAGGASLANITSAHDATVFAGTGTLNFVGGDGASAVLGGAGGTGTITGGSGGLLFSANTDNTTVINGGSGETTVFGGAGSNTTFNSTTGQAILVAGLGNETLNAAGSSANNMFSASSDASSSALLVGGSGSDGMFAGAGVTTMTGGAGADSFVFYKAATAGQHDFITDFGTDDDGLFLSGYDPSQSASSLLNNAVVNGSGVTITLSDNTQITFSNLTSTDSLNGKILYS